ncbi:MAG: TIGR01777 family protein [Ignavibacteriae bacterium]|nr:TIGR01777 family protein [Ignavibacteriota bacterium]
MNIVIAGGTGFIGTALVESFIQSQHHVTLLSRSKHVQKHYLPSVVLKQWDGVTVGQWKDCINNSDAVINLSGELIAGKRWTANQKKNILESRINSTRVLVQAIKEAEQKPKVFVSASAVGYYGNVEQGEVTETHPKGNGFLADVCAVWESESQKATGFGVRVVNPRIGVVVANDGGALPKLLMPFKFGVGGWLGSGKQWFPWIHRYDVVNGMLFAMENEQINGAVNFAAPESVTMKQFCQQLGNVLRRPCWAPVPSSILKLALGEMSEMLLTGQNVVPAKLLDTGYRFHYPTLEHSLQSIFQEQ